MRLLGNAAPRVVGCSSGLGYVGAACSHIGHGSLDPRRQHRASGADRASSCLGLLQHTLLLGRTRRGRTPWGVAPDLRPPRRVGRPGRPGPAIHPGPLARHREPVSTPRRSRAGQRHGAAGRPVRDVAAATVRPRLGTVAGWVHRGAASRRLAPPGSGARSRGTALLAGKAAGSIVPRAPLRPRLPRSIGPETLVRHEGLRQSGEGGAPRRAFRRTSIRSSRTERWWRFQLIASRGGRHRGAVPRPPAGPCATGVPATPRAGGSHGPRRADRPWRRPARSRGPRPGATLGTRTHRPAGPGPTHARRGAGRTV